MTSMNAVIVEDHLMFRDVVRKVCTIDLGISVIGEASSGAEAADLITRLGPSLVLLDLQLVDLNGFDVIERIASGRPETRVIVVSAYCDEYTVFRLQKQRIQGFVDKSTNSVEVLRDAIQSVIEGRLYFSPSYIAARLTLIRSVGSFPKLLSDHEIELLGLIGRGLTDQEIANKAYIAPRTAKKHRSNILRKLGIQSTAKLIVFAIERGIARFNFRIASGKATQHVDNGSSAKISREGLPKMQKIN